MERFDIKKAEIQKLYEAYKIDPSLFTRNPYIEDAAFLRTFGIVIPGKETFPLGYLKLYASDFIVEEISREGSVYTIDSPPSPTEVPTRDPSNTDHRALFATLVKCNISTIEIMEEMAKKLGCPTSSIRYAGLKDKNGITAQAISFHNVTYEKISTLFSKHYFLKDFRWGKGSIEKGGLTGNRFTLFIRTPKPIDQAAFTEQERKVNAEGFYNFFYLQRFGSPRFMAYELGFDILRGKYQDAVIKFITRTSERELPYFRQLRDQIRGCIPDWKKVQELIAPYPLIMFNEHSLVGHLVNHPDDYIGALKAVNEQVTLWVYSFGSLLFNETVSAYIQNGEPVPEKIPLFMSDQREDTEFYAHFLKQLGYYPPDLRNLKPFPHIQFQRRMVVCREKIDIDNIAFSPEGIAVRFSLNKGEYATTFLSHLFNIISGHPPDDIPGDLVDSSSILGHESISATLDYFKDVNGSRKNSGFDALEQAQQ